jgi:murein DD-endopeptidase MepM/ murein hydrolase activator NlpD
MGSAVRTAIWATLFVRSSMGVSYSPATAGPGWGNVMIVLHAYVENGECKYVQSYYGHIEKMLAQAGENVRRGQQIATVGTANGLYFAHLHFEMREFLTPFIGPGYRNDTRGWLDPTAFITQHRGAPEDDVGRPPSSTH